MENITYNNLYNLYKNHQLTPNKQYRLIDYKCTTTERWTKSANNIFDIILTAKSNSEFFEESSAMKHDGDFYFEKNDLSKWVIKYSIENDASKYYWADTKNGYGVIYYMKDEFNNNAPYDFKNIQFERFKSKRDSLEIWLPFVFKFQNLFDFIVSDESKYFYTFTDLNGNDVSLNRDDLRCFSNSIKKNSVICLVDKYWDKEEYKLLNEKDKVFVMYLGNSVSFLIEKYSRLANNNLTTNFSTIIDSYNINENLFYKNNGAFDFSIIINSYDIIMVDWARDDLILNLISKILTTDHNKIIEGNNYD